MALDDLELEPMSLFGDGDLSYSIDQLLDSDDLFDGFNLDELPIEDSCISNELTVVEGSDSDSGISVHCDKGQSSTNNNTQGLSFIGCNSNQSQDGTDNSSIIPSSSLRTSFNHIPVCRIVTSDAGTNKQLPVFKISGSNIRSVSGNGGVAVRVKNVAIGNSTSRVVPVQNLTSNSKGDSANTATQSRRLITSSFATLSSPQIRLLPPNKIKCDPDHQYEYSGNQFLEFPTPSHASLYNGSVSPYLTSDAFNDLQSPITSNGSSRVQPTFSNGNGLVCSNSEYFNTSPNCTPASLLYGSPNQQHDGTSLVLTRTQLERLKKKQDRMIKNRQAASMSRMRKKEYLERLELRYDQLKRENLQLRRQNEDWRSRCNQLEHNLDHLRTRVNRLTTTSGNGDNCSTDLSTSQPPMKIDDQLLHDTTSRDLLAPNPTIASIASASIAHSPPVVARSTYSNINSSLLGRKSVITSAFDVGEQQPRPRITISRMPRPAWASSSSKTTTTKLAAASSLCCLAFLCLFTFNQFFLLNFTSGIAKQSLSGNPSYLPSSWSANQASWFRSRKLLDVGSSKLIESSAPLSSKSDLATLTSNYSPNNSTGVTSRIFNGTAATNSSSYPYELLPMSWPEFHNLTATWMAAAMRQLESSELLGRLPIPVNLTRMESDQDATSLYCLLLLVDLPATLNKTHGLTGKLHLSPSPVIDRNHIPTHSQMSKVSNSSFDKDDQRIRRSLTRRRNRRSQSRLRRNTSSTTSSIPSHVIPQLFPRIAFLLPPLNDLYNLSQRLDQSYANTAAAAINQSTARAELMQFNCRLLNQTTVN